jgi:hypothetical protein
MTYKHTLHKIDCECGCDMFVLDRRQFVNASLNGGAFARKTSHLKW